MPKSSSEFSYTPSPFAYLRRSSREVRVGDLSLGGDAPIRIQSMTTTNTLDVKGSVAQCIIMIASGSELVRFTAPSIMYAVAFVQISDDLLIQCHYSPIVSYIHFTPNAALRSSSFFQTFIFNPCNYSDKTNFFLP